LKILLAKITAALVAYGPWGVFLIGFIDSLGIPLPATMDALLIFIAVKAPERAYFTALMAVLGSLGGNLALFLGARHGSRLLIKTVPEPGKPQRFRAWFRRYGLLTVFVPAVVPVLPLPLKVFVVSAGYLHTPLSRFFWVILLARALRYFGEAYLGIRLGSGAQTFLANNKWPLAFMAVAAVAALFLLIHWRSRGRSTA
jgi:membrane protein YqaA with SNARE-associated domain